MNTRAALLLAAVLAAVAGCSTPEPVAPTTEGPPAAAVAPAAVSAEPTGLDIPTISLHADGLVKLGLDERNEMQIPDDATVTGWYGLGPAPGDLGPAVVAAHVNFGGVPGVFARLHEVKVGDRATVTRADGSTVAFEVYAVDQYAKAQFPSAKVYGNVAGPELRLITCGGRLDSAARSYEDNVVVSARLAA